MKKNLFLSLMMILMIWVSCTRDTFIPTAIDCDSDEIPTYDGVMQEIIDRTCAYATCHDGSATSDAPGDYTTFEGLRPDFEIGIMRRVIDLVDDPVLGMPPNDAVGGPIDLAEADFLLFSCWIDAEFPEN